ITVSFSGSVVQNVFRPFDGLFFYLVKVTPFREILPDQSVQVLVRAPFPTMVGPGKVKIYPQGLGDLFVVGELLAVVAGHGAYDGIQSSNSSLVLISMSLAPLPF